MVFTIVVAKTRGFCWGVKRAIKGAEGVRKRADEPIFVFGHLVHNQQVVDELGREQILVLTSPGEVDKKAPGQKVLITAHGIGPDMRSHLEHLVGKDNLVDMTCPIVENVHKAAEELVAEGRKMVLIGGPRSHAEVRGIIEVLRGRVFLLKDTSEVPNIPFGDRDRIGVIAQTTFDEQKVVEILAAMCKRYSGADQVKYVSKPSVVNPDYPSAICDDIAKKQRELRELGKDCDAVIVVGDPESSNTSTLAKIAREELKKRTAFVPDSRGLDQSFLTGVSRVFLTAGASTPGSSVRSVLNWLEAAGGIREAQGDLEEENP